MIISLPHVLRLSLSDVENLPVVGSLHLFDSIGGGSVTLKRDHSPNLQKPPPPPLQKQQSGATPGLTLDRFKFPASLCHFLLSAADKKGGKVYNQNPTRVKYRDGLSVHGLF